MFGSVLIAIGALSLVFSIGSGGLFFRLVSAVSETKVYRAKGADALQSVSQVYRVSSKSYAH